MIGFVAASGEALAARESAAADIADANVQYALKFLTYASGVPFRRLALLQELNDIFEFAGRFDGNFLSRWEMMAVPERAAFCQSYRELRRMEALEASFVAAGSETDEAAPIEERASHSVAAHLLGLEEWQRTLRYEAETTPRSSATLSLFAQNEQSGQMALDLTFEPVQEAPSPLSLVAQMIPGGDNDIRTVLDSLAPMDGLAQSVLEDMCSAEIKEAQGRFLARVRWMLALPNQQRMAVALRTIGKKRREIAESMNISDGAVKTHLARADKTWAGLTDAQKSSAPRDRAKADRRRQSGADAENAWTS